MEGRSERMVIRVEAGLLGEPTLDPAASSPAEVEMSEADKSERWTRSKLTRWRKSRVL